ncbi:MAG: hypothetical protein ACYTFG_02470 [Planctomycetota bacterium]
MPITLKIDRTLGLVFSTFHGTVDLDQLKDFAWDAWEDESIRGFGELCDISDATAITLTTAESFELAEFACKNQPKTRGKFALLAGTKYQIGLAMMYAGMKENLSLEPGRIDVFTDRSEAVAWLGSGEEP